MTKQTETDRHLNPVAQSTPVLKLLYTAGSGLSERQMPITGKEHWIGREIGPDEGLQLAGDRRASAKHARVGTSSEGAWILDERSKNGTWLNGQEIKERTALADGDIIRIGNSLMLLRYQPPRVVDAPPDQRAVHNRLIGSSPALREVRHLLSFAAKEKHAVLLLGETGTGKELAGQAIHALSGRAGELVAWNCANLNPALAESQLFGHVKGSFTGAQTRHVGLFREAEGKTLFLDEVGELPLDLQPKLLRILESNKIRPVGSDKDEECDVRIVAATNRNLELAVSTGMFRADLFARLSTLTITLPPLRERQEDILPLFLRALGQRPLTARLCEALLLYPWPLNVRELLKLSAHIGAFMPGESELDLPALAKHLLPQPAPAQPPHGAQLFGSASTAAPSVPRSRVKYTPELVQRLMHEERGVLVRVAERLGISRRQLSRILDKFGIDPKSFRQ